MQQNRHLELGRINTLLINRHTPHGLFLTSLDEKDVLLPQRYVTDEMQEGSLVDVFLYTDSEDRLIATTEKPIAMLDEFGFFEVVDTTKFGAFVNWGLLKDLFVPKVFQKAPFRVGEKRFLRVVYDEMTHRLVGTEKISKFLEPTPRGLKVNQEVKALVIAKTPLGFKVIINDAFEGLIYDNEVFESLNIGDVKNAYLKKIRADGGIDVSLQPIGMKKSALPQERILELLEKSKGILPYNYKSDAAQIQDFFGLSKKVFKAALTKLAQDGRIEIKETGIYKRG